MKTQVFMKKVYIIPSCEVHAVSVQSLCMSVRIKDVETSGDNGSWSKDFGGGFFEDADNSAE